MSTDTVRTQDLSLVEHRQGKQCHHLCSTYHVCKKILCKKQEQRLFHERILLVVFFMGSICSSIDVFLNFKRTTYGIEAIYDWSTALLVNVDYFFGQTDESDNSIVRRNVGWIAKGVISTPFYFIHYSSAFFMGATNIGATLTSYLVFLLLSFFGIIMIRIYSNGFLLYIPGFGIDLRANEAII